MKEWMTTKDLSEYLQIPESRIRSLINQGKIPFHDNHGFLRFNRQEIDDWMKSPSPEDTAKQETHDAEKEDIEYTYKGKPIKDYTLAASQVLIGESPWERLPTFIKKVAKGLKEHNRHYLYTHEIKPFLANFYDYLKVSCHLGLIENVAGEEEDRRVIRYYPTDYARRIAAEPDTEKVKNIVLDSILNIVRSHRETDPDERHSILLLWYVLKIKENGIEPQEYHFALSKDKPNSHYPQIRLAFAWRLCYFLFNDDLEKEREFLKDWESLCAEQREGGEE